MFIKKYFCLNAAVLKKERKESWMSPKELKQEYYIFMHLLLWQMKNVNCPVFIFKLLHYSSGSLVHLAAAPDSCSPSPPSSWIFQANLILHTETIARMIDLLPDLQGLTFLISILGVSEGRKPTVCLQGWWQHTHSLSFLGGGTVSHQPTTL